MVTSFLSSLLISVEPHNNPLWRRRFLAMRTPHDLRFFFFLISVTQMLTTQADRFSREEVRSGAFTLLMIGLFHRRTNVIVTMTICRRITSIHIKWMGLMITHFLAHFALFCLCVANTLLLLLFRWSRCSWPSPQMWQGTWTIIIWFT